MYPASRCPPSHDVPEPHSVPSLAKYSASQFTLPHDVLCLTVCQGGPCNCMMPTCQESDAGGVDPFRLLRNETLLYSETKAPSVPYNIYGFMWHSQFILRSLFYYKRCTFPLVYKLFLHISLHRPCLQSVKHLFR